MKTSPQTITYIRVHPDEQRIPSLSVMEQENKLRAYAEKHKLDVVAQYIDDNTSIDFYGSQLKKIFVDLEMKKIKPNCLICMRPDRLSKNLFGAAEMQLQLMGFGIEVRFLEQHCEEGNPLDMISNILDELIAEEFMKCSELHTKKISVKSKKKLKRK